MGFLDTDLNDDGAIDVSYFVVAGAPRARARRGGDSRLRDFVAGGVGDPRRHPPVERRQYAHRGRRRDVPDHGQQLRRDGVGAPVTQDPRDKGTRNATRRPGEKEGRRLLGGTGAATATSGLGGIADVASRGLRSDVLSVLQMEDIATENFRCAERAVYPLDPRQYGAFMAFRDVRQKGTFSPTLGSGKSTEHPARPPGTVANRQRITTSMNSIDSLLHESRRFAPSAEFAANAIAKPELYEAAAADRLGFWADQARAPALARALHPDPRLEQPAVREVVRRRQAQRRLQLPRPPRRWPATATASPSTGRASPATAAASPTPSSPPR